MAVTAPAFTTDELPVVELPIVIDMGKTKRRRVKDLKRGRGRLMDEVADAVNDELKRIRADIGEDVANRIIVPVVLVYKKKRRRKDKGIRLPLLFG